MYTICRSKAIKGKLTLTAAEVRQVIDQYAEKINENRSADRIDNNLNINEWLGN